MIFFSLWMSAPQNTLRTGINGGYGRVHDAAYSILSAVDEETVFRLVAWNFRFKIFFLKNYFSNQFF